MWELNEQRAAISLYGQTDRGKGGQPLNRTRTEGSGLVSVAVSNKRQRSHWDQVRTGGHVIDHLIPVLGASSQPKGAETSASLVSARVGADRDDRLRSVG